MIHCFNTDVAKEIGLLPAILLQNIDYWCEKNKANQTNFYDGSYWTYNSTVAFEKMFSYANKRQIEYALKKLKDGGYIITGNYNKMAYDRTLWYAITKIGKSILQNCNMETTNFVNGNDNIVTPIPNINTNSKPNINTNNKATKVATPKFDYKDYIISLGFGEKLTNSILDFKAYKKEIGFTYKEIGFRKLCTEIKNKADIYGEDKVINAINIAMSSGYKGIAWFSLDKEQPKPKVEKEKVSFLTIEV